MSAVGESGRIANAPLLPLVTPFGHQQAHEPGADRACALYFERCTFGPVMLRTGAHLFRDGKPKDCLKRTERRISMVNCDVTGAGWTDQARFKEKTI
jgi:hypothetical protein